GVHAVKIEGRMKSVYYTAVVARAYRKALDALDGREPPGLEDYKNELHNISHREYSTGFYFDSREIETPTRESYLQEYRLLGTVLGVTAEGLAEIDVRNSFSKNRSIQYIGPHVPFIDDSGFVIFNEKMEETDKALHGKRHFLKTDKPLKTGFIIRGRLN
ncbi:MAG: U32 family peptidase, partial [Spirochaetales bacterium]